MSTPPSYARFYRAFALTAVLVALLVATATTLEFAWGLRKFGGLEYVPRVVALSATRVLASGIASSAALVGWLIQTQGWDAATTRGHFRPLAWRAALYSLLGYFPCLGLVLAIAIGVSSLLYGIAPDQFVEVATGFVSIDDVLAGLRSSILEMIPLLATGYLLMPWFAASNFRLATKLMVLCLGIGALRFFAELPGAFAELVVG